LTSSKEEAVTWLTAKLASLSGPVPVHSYIKSGEFHGILFAQFRNALDRDTAVALLRSAGLTHHGKNIWAKEDLPIETRSPKCFLLGLKRALRAWGFSKINVDDDFTNLKLGSETGVAVECIDGKLRYKWHEKWANWKELQESMELREITQQAEDMLSKAQAPGKGKGAAKGNAQA
jgi:hypothetical protein